MGSSGTKGSPVGITDRQSAGPGGDTLCDPICITLAPVPSVRTRTHVENREARTKQQKRWEENTSGTAELS